MTWMAEAEAWVMIPKLDKYKTGCVLDMHPLVLCKDCDNRECDGRAGTIVCGITGNSHSRLWFCADGERKEGDRNENSND